MTTYCAPCLADLALVREASTAVAGTASCMAHAVLLLHPADDPQRRRQRLAQLRDSATEKLETAGPEEQLRLEILVEEYGLASAMESLVPRRRDEAGPTSRSARKRRGRDGRERPDGEHRGEPREHRDGRPPRGPRPAGAPTPGGAVADGSAEQQGADALAQVGAPSGEPPASVLSDATPSDSAFPDSAAAGAAGAAEQAPGAGPGDVVPAVAPAPSSSAEAPAETPAAPQAAAPEPAAPPAEPPPTAPPVTAPASAFEPQPASDASAPAAERPVDTP